MLSGCSQLMWARSHGMWAREPRCSQLIWARNRDVIGPGKLCSRVATDTGRQEFIRRNIYRRANQFTPKQIGVQKRLQFLVIFAHWIIAGQLPIGLRENRRSIIGNVDSPCALSWI